MTKNSNDLDHERLGQLQSCYVTKRNKSTATNKVAIANYESKLAKNIKQDSKSFFKYVKCKQKFKDKVGPLIDNSGEVVIEDGAAAKILNDYFGSVFTKENTNNIPEPKNLYNGKDDEMLSDIICNKECVLEILTKMKIDKSPGIDQLHPKFLYEVRHEISGVISIIFNESIRTGVIPRDWRDALVTPIFKKGKRSEPGNYRPVSLTSVLCKVLEKIVKAKLLDHLTK